MRCRATRFVALPAIALIAGALSPAASLVYADGVEPTDCMKTRTEARYSGYGYDHFVHLTNGCEKPMRCSVTTSANPEATTVTVARGKTESVVTFRGSPAREFEAQVSCQPTS